MLAIDRRRAGVARNFSCMSGACLNCSSQASRHACGPATWPGHTVRGRRFVRPRRGPGGCAPSPALRDAGRKARSSRTGPRPVPDSVQGRATARARPAARSASTARWTTSSSQRHPSLQTHADSDHQQGENDEVKGHHPGDTGVFPANGPPCCPAAVAVSSGPDSQRADAECRVLDWVAGIRVAAFRHGCSLSLVHLGGRPAPVSTSDSGLGGRSWCDP